MDKLPYQDSGWAWVVVAAYFTCTFCMNGILRSLGILLVEFVTYFDVSVARASMMVAVETVVFLVTAPISTVLGEYVGQRKVCIVGAILGAIGLSASSLLFNMEYVVFLIAFFYGGGNAAMFTNGLVMIQKYFLKHRSKATGLGSAGTSVGMMTVPLLLQFLLDMYGLRGALLIIGAVYFNCLVCVALYRPISFYTRSTRSKLTREDDTGNHLLQNKDHDDNVLMEAVASETDNCGKAWTADQYEPDVGENHRTVKEITLSSDVQRTVSGSDKFKRYLKDFKVLKSFVVAFYTCVNFIIYFTYFNFPIFLPGSALSRGVEDYEKAVLVSIIGFCELFGRLVIGLLGDSGLVKRYILASVAAIVAGGSIVVFELVESYPLMAVSVAFYGFSGGCFSCLNVPVLVDFVGQETLPKAMAAVILFQGIGAAVGQPCLGALRDAFGSFRPCNLMMGVMFSCGGAVLLLYPVFNRLQQRLNTQSQPTQTPEVCVLVHLDQTENV